MDRRTCGDPNIGVLAKAAAKATADLVAAKRKEIQRLVGGERRKAELSIFLEREISLLEILRSHIMTLWGWPRLCPGGSQLDAAAAKMFIENRTTVTSVVSIIHINRKFMANTSVISRQTKFLSMRLMETSVWRDVSEKFPGKTSELVPDSVRRVAEEATRAPSEAEIDLVAESLVPDPPSGGASHQTKSDVPSDPLFERFQRVNRMK